MTDYDVVVVGFGPAGAVAAGLLGQAGLRVLAVDRSPDIYDKPRAIAIDHEILRVFQNMGVAEAVLPHVAPFPASEHFGVDGQLIRRIDMVRAALPARLRALHGVHPAAGRGGAARRMPRPGPASRCGWKSNSSACSRMTRLRACACSGRAPSRSP